MAAARLTDDELYSLHNISDLFDKNVGEILMKINLQDREDTESELSELCDKEELRNIRDKIFELAKEKIVRDLVVKDAVDLLDDTDLAIAIGQSDALARGVLQWEAVNRRVKHKLANDAVHFLLYLIGHSTKFPTKLIRDISLDRTCLEEDILSDDLALALSKDLEKADGPVDITLVNVNGDSEQYTITFTKETPEECNPVPENDPGDTKIKCDNNIDQCTLVEYTPTQTETSTE